jgi:DNA mismatch repair protein MutS2
VAATTERGEQGPREPGCLGARGVEWEAVRALLVELARSPLGRERAAALEPLTDIAAVRAALEATSEARCALAELGPPPLADLPDPRPALARCRLAGSVLDGPELLVLAEVLDRVGPLRAWGRAAGPRAPRVATPVATLPALDDLHRQLRRCLTEDGGLQDDASPRLRRLRRELRERRQRLVEDLERRLHGPDAERLFADRYVTIRHGRYVLPVRAEARGRVPGIVHDRSQSGQTVFVEPADTVEANNDLVQLRRDEEEEIARILGDLTGAVRARLGDLEEVVERLAGLDLVVARAELAERMEATAPRVDEGLGLEIRAARHPLLVAQRWAQPDRPVVPIDLVLPRERPVLVITGPNAGGKTLALKTLALLVLMAQSGCHIPAAPGARLPLVRRLYTLIGDEQSVAENLSTFSAFLTHVREILEEADDHSLVLLDELGAGTDPDEGAALAQAILEALADRGALVLATTHLEPLKVFASSDPRATNASVEFDSATLTPTFRLRYGHPGRSLALTMAARLGLDPDLIARAERHRCRQAARLSELLARLDEHARAEAERAADLARREREAVQALAAAAEAEAAARRQATEIVDRARREAGRLLAEIRRAVSAEWEQLKRAERSKRHLEGIRQRLGEAAAKLGGPADAPGPEVASALTPGARVAAVHLGLRGELMAIHGGTATVRSGTVTVRVPVQALRPEGDPSHPSGAGRGEVRVPDKPGVPSELRLLGRTTDEARDLVEKYLDDAFMAGLATVRLVHGKGTGALRRAIRDLLAAHPLVASFRDGEPGEGGAGATVAALRVSA